MGKAMYMGSMDSELRKARQDRRELVAACEKAMEWFDRFGEHSAVVFGGEAEMYEQLRTAVANAKGE